ncbi:cyclic nucleotide-gated channel [Acrasis kona]|uniref:Cyclic nucleotide-gated channel n=1 Tax=Acrasis kona TaxID=1008807 RepID=A0AAW2Z2F9_9EUKA
MDTSIYFFKVLEHLQSEHPDGEKELEKLLNEQRNLRPKGLVRKNSLPPAMSAATQEKINQAKPAMNGLLNQNNQTKKTTGTKIIAPITSLTKRKIQVETITPNSDNGQKPAKKNKLMKNSDINSQNRNTNVGQNN